MVKDIFNRFWNSFLYYEHQSAINIRFLKTAFIKDGFFSSTFVYCEFNEHIFKVATNKNICSSNNTLSWLLKNISPSSTPLCSCYRQPAHLHNRSSELWISCWLRYITLWWIPILIYIIFIKLFKKRQAIYNTPTLGTLPPLKKKKQFMNIVYVPICTLCVSLH